MINQALNSAIIDVARINDHLAEFIGSTPLSDEDHEKARRAYQDLRVTSRNLKAIRDGED